MLKRIALICALAIFLGGCSLPLPNKPEPSQTEEYADPAKYIHEFQNNLQYQQLDSVEQHAYGQIYTTIRDNEKAAVTVPDANGQQRPGIRIPLSDAQFTREEMSHLFETFFRDNPRFFYLDRTYSLEGYDLDGQTVYDTLLLQFTMDTEQRIEAIKKFDQAVADFLAERPNTDDDYEIELYLHNRLLKSCIYDSQAAASSSSAYANAYSAYGALIEGKAVCEGYAKAMQLLLNASSIPTTVVLGNAVEDGEAHMWNLTNINGSYYYLDPTWNDDDEGNLVRDRDYGTSGNKKIGYMYYKTRMTDFTVEFEYRHSTASSAVGWQTMYVGFGAQKIGGFAEADAHYHSAPPSRLQAE